MVPPAAEPSPSTSAREALLAWYRPRRSAYPWRRARPDPYAVLVSEVMLQQTQAARVVPAFEAFMVTLPDGRPISRRRLAPRCCARGGGSGTRAAPWRSTAPPG